MKTNRSFCLITVAVVLSFALYECQKAPATGTVKNYPSSLSKKEVDALAPIEKSEPLTLTSLDNQTYKIGKESDKKTILILFATWCGTCKMAMPAIDSAFSKREDVNILAVGRQHGTEELKAWKNKTGYSLPIVADSSGAISSKFATQYVPRFYVIDTSGNVLHQDFGWGEYMIQDMNKVVSGQ